MKLLGFILMSTLYLWVLCEAAPQIAKKSMTTHHNSTLPDELQSLESKRTNNIVQEAIVWGVIISLVLIISAFLFCPFCCYCIAEHCQRSSTG